MQGTMLTQLDVEGEIWRLVQLLEDKTRELAILAERSADADMNFKADYAGTMVRLVDEQMQAGLKESEAVRVARVENVTMSAHRLKRHSEAIERACRDACSNIRSQLSAMQTISSNIRGQT